MTGHAWGRGAVWIAPVGVAYAAFVGLLVPISMVGAIAATVLPVLLVLAVTNPRFVALALIFLAVAVPKAGIKVGGFPFPVALFGIGIAILLLPALGRRRPHRAAITGLLFLYLAWVAFRSNIAFASSAAEGFAFFAWTMLPMAYLYFATTVVEVDGAWLRWMERGFMVAAGFAVVQQLFGIEETKVPGITIAFGDSYEVKHNVLFAGAGGADDFSKVMSTYQGGNLFGLIAAFFLVLAATRLVARQATRWDYGLLAAAAWSVGLSGSRTAILATAAGGLVLVLGRGSLGKKLAFAAAILTGFFLIRLALPGLAHRYSIANLVESGGAGRLEIWREGLSRLSWREWLIGSDEFFRMEGAPGMVSTLGIVGMMVALVLIVGLVPWHLGWIPPMMALFAGISVDLAYAYFPTLFLPAAAVAGAALHAGRSGARTDDKADAIA